MVEDTENTDLAPISMIKTITGNDVETTFVTSFTQNVSFQDMADHFDQIAQYLLKLRQVFLQEQLDSSLFYNIQE